ncbi:hypothetical protein Cs7R123_27010 [Catellatospora sp. TT07R-123]|uniref:Rv0361 family membrane protein n=1 Tax=Catellatospora sp. TT07R-123 TaxID=2733863 RepID=UPI001B2C2555|nr:hypothetical protein [Catellatospora sp. TT07R-123]GHJ45359.1 hypothetical protein Cs7R123_27010 [Catellatospora sp. TT07R-123]
MTEMSATPAVPPGPGARPPFPAAPTEGGGTRLGWGLGIAGLLLVLCCGGGLVTGVGVLATQVQALNEQARAQVGRYLDALRDRDYDKAYGLLCDAEQKQLDLDRFTRREQSRPEKVRSYELGKIDVNGSDLELPVDETYADGTSGKVVYYLAQDRKTGQFEVCGRS